MKSDDDRAIDVPKLREAVKEITADVKTDEDFDRIEAELLDRFRAELLDTTAKPSDAPSEESPAPTDDKKKDEVKP